MNQEQAGKILRANVKSLPEPLKSAVEFTLATFYAPSAATEAIKFLVTNFQMLNPEFQEAVKAVLTTFEERLGVINLPNEEWRPVVGYEGIYDVSNFGRVKSYLRGKVHLLKYQVDAQGYVIVTLYRNGHEKRAKVHILVAQAFIPNPGNKPQVNHIDGNKANPHVSNLEWVTPSENMLHAFRIGLKKSATGSKNGKAKLTDDDIRYIRKHYKKGTHAFGLKTLARKFNVNISTIARIVKYKVYKNVI